MKPIKLIKKYPILFAGLTAAKEITAKIAIIATVIINSIKVKAELFISNIITKI